MSDNFAHLHVHSAYSMLDGKSDLDALMSRAAELGQPAVAITDHGNLHGAYEAYKMGQKYDVKSIVGIEAYTAPGTTSRLDKTRVLWGDGGGDDVSGNGAYHHITLWAENNTGLRNMFRLSSRASLEGFYRQPRIDRELLDELHDGIIGTTGCPSGEVQTWLRLGHYDNALAAAAELRDIFGADNFFLELMDHGLDIENRVREDLLRIGRTLQLPLVATNDLHYVAQEDAAAHDAMLCVQSGSKLADENRFKFSGDDYYLKTAAEMRALFHELPDACDNTLLIAERCNTSFTEGADLMPRYPVPDGETIPSWFAKEVQTGLHQRYPAGIPDDRQQQADYEIKVITDMGFPGYFLVTADFIQWAKQQGIRVGPGRGSAAGSIVAYALGITDLDPIEHGLFFERFLNPERKSMPDIDVDFDDTRRGEVIQYVADKYGADHVSQLVTFGKVKAKAAIKDATRILGKPYGLGDKITKLYPAPIVGRDMPLAGVFDPTHERYSEAADLHALIKDDADVREVMDVARGLEGVIRQTGVHAAGVILGAEPLMDHIPVMKRESDGAIITQFDQKTCETLGLLKMDFLGLRNLTVINEALRLIAHQTGQAPNLDELPLDDPDTYALLSRGDTLGVFQLDGGPMRSLLRAMKPDNFEDISAVLALYRPGPMGANAHISYADRKNDRAPITPIHPALADALEPILGVTYGLIVYQEQVMAIAQQLAGYSLGKADQLRRAMGKKDPAVLQAEYGTFADGMRERGFPDDAIETLWGVLLPFSDYAFNKAHSAAYGMVSYYTAWLKTHHTAAYMAALLTSTSGDKDKAAVYLDECRKLGIEVLPPCVNESGGNYTPVDATRIRVGLTSIRNIGQGVVDQIVQRRDNNPYTSFEHFLNATLDAGVNKRAVESLIKAGGFDSLHDNRAALHSIHAEAVDACAKMRRKAAAGQVDMFAHEKDVVAVPVPTDIPDWDRSTRLNHERDMLGQYVSDHPLRGMQQSLDKHSDGPIAEQFPPGHPPARRTGTVTIAGIITAVTTKRTKKAGDPYVIVTVEDTTSSVEVTAFPNTYKRNPDLWAADSVIAAKVRVEMREGDTYALHASSVRSVTPKPDSDTGAPTSKRSAVQAPQPATAPVPAVPAPAAIHLTLDSATCDAHLLTTITALLRDHPGEIPVSFHYRTGDDITPLSISQEYRISLNPPAVLYELKGLLGSDSVTY